MAVKVYDCQNDFCTDWEKNKCLLTAVSVNGQGQCEDCVFIQLDEEELKQKRRELRMRLKCNSPEKG